MRQAARACVVLLALAAAAPSPAQDTPPRTEAEKPADPAVERRLKNLAEELRCLVCQNQTIADSNATLAVDLRNTIRTQIARGDNDAQIREYMVKRYGDFVLYRPPLKATTIALWLGPLILLIAGGAIFLLTVRRKRAVAGASPEPEERHRIEALLEGSEVAGQPAPATSTSTSKTPDRKRRRP